MKDIRRTSSCHRHKKTYKTCRAASRQSNGGEMKNTRARKKPKIKQLGRNRVGVDIMQTDAKAPSKLAGNRCLSPEQLAK